MNVAGGKAGVGSTPLSFTTGQSENDTTSYLTVQAETEQLSQSTVHLSAPLPQPYSRVGVASPSILLWITLFVQQATPKTSMTVLSTDLMKLSAESSLSMQQ